jgi:uncharacterized membrane protein YdbT with pleckstrin-like domain
MPTALRDRLLRWLSVPSDPQPPPGDPRQLRTFRASHRFLRYRTIVWALKQASALGALLVGYFLLSAGRSHLGGAMGIINLIEIAAWFGFVTQLPFSYALLRIDFDMRWYILSDRSLRIREGVLSVREQTMTFANVQNISIRQNPLQRIFGIADVAVRAAGGGGGSAGSASAAGGSASLREAAFRGVDNASEIRDLIRERIRHFRDAGLGDPDEPPAPATPPLQDAVLAARELLGEVRALRGTTLA